MIEIIKREEDVMSEKEQINGWEMQVSYNDWGHLAVRVIHSKEPVADTLVVFNKAVSDRIIEFARKIKLSGIPEDDIPF